MTTSTGKQGSETKWTPGPYSEPSPYGLLGYELQAQGRSIAVVNRVDSTRLSHLRGRMDAKAKRGEAGHDEAREAKEIEGRAAEALATAHLLSAAPEMYEALKRLSAFIPRTGPGSVGAAGKALDAALAAIAKAEARHG